MNSGRLIVAIAAAAGMLATFLPWIHAPIVGAIYGTKGDGWITFVLFAITLAVAIAKDRNQPFSPPTRILVAVPAAAAAGVGVWKMIELNNQLSSLGDNPLAKAISQTVGIGAGLYVVLAAGILIPVLAFVVGRGAKAP